MLVYFPATIFVFIFAASISVALFLYLARLAPIEINEEDEKCLLHDVVREYNQTVILRTKDGKDKAVINAYDKHFGNTHFADRPNSKNEMSCAFDEFLGLFESSQESTISSDADFVPIERTFCLRNSAIQKNKQSKVQKIKWRKLVSRIFMITFVISIILILAMCAFNVLVHNPDSNLIGMMESIYLLVAITVGGLVGVAVFQVMRSTRKEG